MIQLTRRVGYFVLGTLIIGCGSKGQAPAQAHAPPEAIPERVAIASGTITWGFALGTTRRPEAVAAFRITKAPVTVANYKKCVAGGACTPPSLKDGSCGTKGGADGQTYSSDPGAADFVLTCADAEQAKAYCNWVGGRLPTALEWSAAARGPDVHRYAWGDSAPTCQQRGRVSYFADFEHACCEASCADLKLARVGQHSAGDSPYGVTDVLLTRAELLGPDLDDGGSGCLSESVGCVVHGTGPGAIDGLAPVSIKASYGFRCVWPGVAQ
jgi:formylglycine-generating enzyme required for sulfatase activity